MKSSGNATATKVKKRKMKTKKVIGIFAAMTMVLMLVAMPVSATTAWGAATDDMDPLAEGTVTSGKTNELGLGGPIAGSTNQPEDYYDWENDDNVLTELFDGKISFNDGGGYDEYDVREIIALKTGTNDIVTTTSLAGGDEDYKTEVGLEIGIASIYYYYAFDDSINVSTASATYPLDIDFFGQPLSIRAATATTITALLGKPTVLESGASTTVGGYVIDVVVWDTADARITVDGQAKSFTSEDTMKEWDLGSETKEVYVDTISFNTATGEGEVEFYFGDQTEVTYTTGQYAPGEDEDDPDWIMDISGLTGLAATSVTAAGTETGPVLGITNDFIVKSSTADDPTGAISNSDKIGYNIATGLPGYTIEIAGLTNTDDYKYVKFQTVDSPVVEDYDDGTTGEYMLMIDPEKDDGFKIESAAWTNLAADTDADKVYLEYSNSTDGMIFLHYQDEGTWSTAVMNATFNNAGAAETLIGYLENGATKDTDVNIYLGAANLTDTTDVDLYISVVPAVAEIYGAASTDDIVMKLLIEETAGNGQIHGLGDTRQSEEPDDLQYGGYQAVAAAASTTAGIGSRDEDQMTSYGIKIDGPSGTVDSDLVTIHVPSDAVRATVGLRAYGAAAVVGEVNAPGDGTPSSGDLIVGGPCVNKWAALAINDDETLVCGADSGMSSGEKINKDYTITVGGADITVRVLAGYTKALTDEAIADYMA